MAERETFRPSSGIRESYPGRGSVSDVVGHLSQGMSSLVRGHLDLARAELKQDLRGMVKAIAMEAAGAPLLMVGYLLFWVAISWLIALALPNWAAFGISALVNLIGGAALLGWGRARQKREKIDLPDTTNELRRDRRWISSMRSEPTALETRH